MPTSLRGFDGYSKRQAIEELEQKFEASEFYYRDAMQLEHINAKLFAKLYRDGILVKIGKLWPSRWRIARQYLLMACEPLALRVSKKE